MEVVFDGIDSVWIKIEPTEVGVWKHISIVDGKVYIDGEEHKNES
jgi:hypothetical protein